jgi:gliding motility-associated-like protein
MLISFFYYQFQQMNRLFYILLLHLFSLSSIHAQNSMVGDGFGGRLWYKPTNFSVGSYSGYTICSDTTNPQNNQLYGWGSNITNQLGLGNTIGESASPTQIPNIDSVKYFSTGYVMGAIKFNNSGWAWGIEFNQAPVQVITDVYFCDASSANVSFVKNDGTVWSIGRNDLGNFGNAQVSVNFELVPIQMHLVNNAVRVANQAMTTCVLLEDSTLVIAGSTYYGLGFNTPSSYTALPIPNLPKIIDIKSNAQGTAALTANGDVYYWGSDISGENYVPIKIDSLSNIVAISGCDDGYHFFALDVNKNCYAWGNNFGQLGDPLSLPIPLNDPILVATDVIDIMAGESFSYIVKSDGTLWAVGSGSIWLNLTNEARIEFTQLNPEIVPGWCEPIIPEVIFFPNVFTPNGDQINDEFLFTNMEIDKLNATIMNRWGNVVATFDEPSDSWDGKTENGQECTDGTYYYVLHYKPFGEDWITKKGFLTLTR